MKIAILIQGKMRTFPEGIFVYPMIQGVFDGEDHRSCNKKAFDEFVREFPTANEIKITKSVRL